MRRYRVPSLAQPHRGSRTLQANSPEGPGGRVWRPSKDAGSTLPDGAEGGVQRERHAGLCFTEVPSLIGTGSDPTRAAEVVGTFLRSTVPTDQAPR